VVAGSNGVKMIEKSEWLGEQKGCEKIANVKRGKRAAGRVACLNKCKTSRILGGKRGGSREITILGEGMKGKMEKKGGKLHFYFGKATQGKASMRRLGMGVHPLGHHLMLMGHGTNKGTGEGWSRETGIERHNGGTK